MKLSNIIIKRGFFRNIDSKSDNCKNLWQTVLDMALGDALTEEHQTSISDWINSNDFEVICYYSGLSPNFVKNVFNKALNNESNTSPFISTSIATTSYLEYL
jgi:2-hydroxy-3-keto-5-methylthiopentenyl-1-phosphate phosphatase